MLHEKIGAFDEYYYALKSAHDAIQDVKPLKENIQKACENIKAFLDSPSVVSVDPEIKAALTSVYTILEAANTGLKDPTIASLFETSLPK